MTQFAQHMCILAVSAATMACGTTQSRSGSCPSAKSVATDTPSADAIFGKILQRYATLAVYEDDSVILSWTAVANDPRLRLRAMESDIRFERPERMRLRFRVRDQFASSWGLLVWNGNDIQSRTSYESGTRRWPRFDEAAGALTGVSAETTTVIPSLLHGKNPWRCRGEEPKAEFAGREVVGRTDCRKLALVRRLCPPVFLWYDERTFLLRKIQMSIDITDEKSAEYRREMARALPANAPAAMRARLEVGAASSTERIVVINARTEGPADENGFVMPVDGEGGAQ